ncbi:DUF1592 domain-containing protein [Rosistilla oblonga]|uniref:DUF1592 domain-containing protein n=1 Tax=Rosistilla oblonga TaxID=2527990 RepID=UPI003A970C4B
MNDVNTRYSLRDNKGFLPLIAWILLTMCSAALHTSAADEQPSLEELKAVGAQKSRFKNAQPSAEPPAHPEPDLAEFRETIGPILKQACVDCHGPDAQEGNVRIDTLDPDLLSGEDVDWWTEVFAAISKGEMPPPDEGELTDEDREKVVNWLANEMQVASTVRRRSGGHSAFRRMTRYEYNYALQDLLGLPWDFAKDLPPESHSEDGFQNSSELLHMSVSQFETYHRIARTALARATVRGQRPAVRHWGVSMKKVANFEWPKQAKEIEKVTKQFKDDPDKQQEELDKLDAKFKQSHRGAYFRELSTGRTAAATWQYYGAKYAFAPTDSPAEFPESFDTVAVLPANRGTKLIVELGNQVPDEGTMRVRVRASRTTSDDSPAPSMQMLFGWQASNEGRALIRVSEQDTLITAGPDQPEIYQWDFPLGEIYPRNSVRKTSPMGVTPSPSEYIRLANSTASPGDIQVDYVEISAPVYDQWPPASHKKIFFDSKNADDEPAYAREIIAAFMHRAWRRTVSEDELDRKLKLFDTLRPQCNSFEEAVTEVLATILSSPHFLYIAQNQADETPESPSERQPLTQHELATRLSMFLWCSLPDEELLELADSGQLADSQTLTEQVQRMLADPRSERFAKQFVHQWLDLQLLDFLNIKQNVRGFDPLLKEAMQHEPIALFHEVLDENESVLNFIHTDFAMANERLARHYGLKGVRGNHFRRVALDGDFKLGGILTQAGLLAMNSDWPDSHPLKRGVWLLESILNDPPPPPPPAVPQIDLADPEIAKMTLKERIEDHRNHAACMSCHVKIDPWGIAFENYDALGRWRNEIDGKPVSASSELFNRETLDGMEGLKRFLLENRQDQFVGAMVHKLTTYALGRPLTFADRADVDTITAEVRSRDDGLATMIQTIIASELFQTQ